MVRPKVKPQNRQRSVIACTPCKRSKIKCDAGTPCSTCLKRGREGSCIYPDRSAGASDQARAVSHLSSPSGGVRTSVEQPEDPNGQLVETKTTDEPLPAVSESNMDVSNDEISGPQGRTLWSSKLQKVYIGENGALSYLQFLRRVLKRRVGPCAFTEGEFNNFMLEMDLPNGPGEEMLHSLDMTEKQALVQWYLDATSGVIDLFSKSDILASLDNLDFPECPVGLASTYLVLAIGAQCRGKAPLDLRHATNFFAGGQKLAFDGMLLNPSLGMVHEFLLMAFYMLGACHRNAAFMYLGVASKAAVALGLYRSEQYRDATDDERRTRLNAWKSLRVVDSIVNSLLGRASTFSNMQQDSRLSNFNSSNKSNRSSRELALQAMFEICPFIDELERNGQNNDVDSVEDFLQRLQQWSKALPEELRNCTESNLILSGDNDREAFIGGTHVACVYYFAVILATRRFFTIHMLSLSNREKRFETFPLSGGNGLDEKHSSLSYVCFKAAVNLAKVGHNAMQSERMVNNMCLIKAWIFAAGLLIGFSLFSQCSNLDHEATEAFHSAREVEKKLALLSPQAAHYQEILSAFWDAIELRQKQLLEEKKRLTSRYIDQIFTADATTNTSSAPIIPQPVSNISIPNYNPIADNGPPTYSADYDFMFDSYGTEFTDGFPWPADDMAFDWQSIAPIFDTGF